MAPPTEIVQATRHLRLLLARRSSSFDLQVIRPHQRQCQHAPPSLDTTTVQHSTWLRLDPSAEPVARRASRHRGDLHLTRQLVDPGSAEAAAERRHDAPDGRHPGNAATVACFRCNRRSRRPCRRRPRASSSRPGLPADADRRYHDFCGFQPPVSEGSASLGLIAASSDFRLNRRSGKLTASGTVIAGDKLTLSPGLRPGESAASAGALPLAIAAMPVRPGWKAVTSTLRPGCNSMRRRPRDANRCRTARRHRPPPEARRGDPTSRAPDVGDRAAECPSTSTLRDVARQRIEITVRRTGLDSSTTKKRQKLDNTPRRPRGRVSFEGKGLDLRALAAT